MQKFLFFELSIGYLLIVLKEMAKRTKTKLTKLQAYLLSLRSYSMPDLWFREETVKLWGKGGESRGYTGLVPG